MQVIGTVVHDDGTTTEFSLGSEGWNQWGGTEEQLWESLPVVEAMQRGCDDDAVFNESTPE